MLLKEIRATNGETIKVANDWSGECEQRAATVLTSSWDQPYTSASLVGNVATAVIAPQWDYTLRNTVTLSNGETLIADRLVWVE